MKILKEGELPENKPHKETCYNCKTKFEYIKADVESDWRDGDYVKCPKCGRFITAKSFLSNL